MEGNNKILKLCKWSKIFKLSCLNGYIKFESECNSVTYCGEKSTSNDYIFETCTNSLIVTYVASQSINNDYRGFNMYYEGNMSVLNIHFWILNSK